MIEGISHSMLANSSGLIAEHYSDITALKRSVEQMSSRHRIVAISVAMTQVARLPIKTLDP